MIYSLEKARKRFQPDDAAQAKSPGGRRKKNGNPDGPIKATISPACTKPRCDRKIENEDGHGKETRNKQHDSNNLELLPFRAHECQRIACLSPLFLHSFTISTLISSRSQFTSLRSLRPPATVMLKSATWTFMALWVFQVPSAPRLFHNHVCHLKCSGRGGIKSSHVSKAKWKTNCDIWV